MRKRLLLLLACALVLSQHSFGQAVGDLGSNGSGNWASGYHWLVCTSAGTWAGATDYSTATTASQNVWILNGDQMTVPSTATTTVACNNLYVQNGATLFVGSSGSVATVNCNGNLYVYAGSTLKSNSTSGIQNVIAMVGSNTTPVAQIDGTFGDNNATHWISLIPKVANSTLSITSSISSPPTAYIYVVKPNAAGIAINFKRNITLTNTSVGLCYSNSSTQGYDGTVVTIDPGVVVTTTGAVAVNTSALSVPGAGGGGNGTLNLNGTLNAGGGFAVKNDPTKSFTLNVGSTGVLNIGKHFNLPTGNGGLTLTVNAGGAVNFTGTNDSCSVADAVTTMNGTWDMNNTIANGRSLGTASIGGTLKFTDNGFPVSITLNSGSTVEYDGTAGITLGSLPATFSNLTLNNAGGISLGTATTVNGSLNTLVGSLTTGNNNLSLGASASATFSAGTSLQISGGVTDFNNRPVTLQSTSTTNTASIGTITGTLNNANNVTIQQYLTAQRAYRLLGHPFNNNIPISVLQSYVDITGTGTGLTAGNASAFNYTTGVWAGYTDNTQTWNKNEALFLFVRGTTGQGIGVTNGSYTPNAPTISLTGSVNTGNLNYTVKAAGSFSNGAAVGWNAIGNPYPAPIDVNSVGNITGPGGTGASIYVWVATMGSTGAGVASGGYDFRTLGSSIVIPEYGAFFIKNTSGLDQVINFTESNKSTGTPLSLFGANTTTTQSFLLTIADNATYWDKLKISFDDKSSTASTDKTDLEKFSNINLDFYSLASDNNRLAINSRPVLQSTADIIPLGLKTNQQRSFTVNASEVNVATGSNLYLHDKYTNNWMKIENGMSYTFSVTADTASQGNNRFEVAMKATVQPVVISSAPSALTVEAGPSPMNSVLTIRYASPQAMPTNIRITDISGKTVTSIHAGKVQSGVQQVATDTWNSGVYVVQVSNGKEMVTKKVVKK